ncbi:MAG: lantibiotic dehydratase family protein [Acidobacteriota bacterium]
MDVSFKCLKEFVLRTPYFPIEYLEKLYCNTVSISKLNKIYKIPEVQEAIFLASPNLFNKLIQWLKGELDNKKKEKKLHDSLHKYIVRMSSRATPFGLFSGVSTGEISDRSEIRISNKSNYKRHTRLDMNFLCSIATRMTEDNNIKRRIKFFPNSSIYSIGKKIRYIEYRYKASKRSHHLVEVGSSEYLTTILKKADGGELYNNLVESLIDSEITLKEAEDYIDELISSQVLVGELEPVVTGEEYLDRIISILSKNKATHFLPGLKAIKEKLYTIDNSQIGTTINAYEGIIEKLKLFNIEFNEKYLFQCDMKKDMKKYLLKNNVPDDILKGVKFLKRITGTINNPDLENFKEDFLHRYEQREMSLVKVLDTETGIGYGINKNNSGDVSPLITGISFARTSNSFDIKWNGIDSIVLKKYLSAIKNSEYSVILFDKDFNDFNAKWDDFPDTFSVMTSVFKTENGDTKIHLKSAGGSSGVNLLGRFCHVDERINKIVKEIIKKEEELKNDKVFAEIVHLPESRTGNILFRPNIRKYEIPYLAGSSVPVKNQININDLMISIKGNRIILRSKKLKKEILPRLGTAHNYSFNVLPIYKFLCDLQTQGLSNGLSFSWGPLANEYEFLPRVEYENLILFPATWNFKVKEFLKIYENKDKDSLLLRLHLWRKDKKIPSNFLLVDGDNKLLFNFEDSFSIDTFHSLTKKREKVKLEEFLFDIFESIVTGDDGLYTNEFIFSYYKENSKNESNKRI